MLIFRNHGIGPTKNAKLFLNDFFSKYESIEGFNVLIENSDLKQALINAIN